VWSTNKTLGVVASLNQYGSAAAPAPAPAPALAAGDACPTVKAGATHTSRMLPREAGEYQARSLALVGAGAEVGEAAVRGGSKHHRWLELGESAKSVGAMAVGGVEVAV
jgi:hypothetical protein